MNRIEKLMKALPEGADAALITSDVNRRYFTGLGSTAGTLLAFRDAAYFIIDFRYIEVAKATVTGAEVILQDKLYDQLSEPVEEARRQNRRPRNRLHHRWQPGTVPFPSAAGGVPHRRRPQ